MRKSMFVFVILVVLGMAVPASSQSIAYIPQTWDGVQYRIMGNQVQMLTADNLGLVNGLTDQLRRAGYRSLARDIRWDDRYGAYGIPIGQGFYPMYDRDRRPMSKKKAAIVYGAIGAVGGGLVGRYVGPGTRRNQITSTIVGAGFGALVGALTHRGNDRNVVVTPPSQDQQGVRVGRDGIPVAVGTKPNRSVSGGFWTVGSTSGGRPNCMAEGMVTLDNQTSGPIRVFQNSQPFEVLMPKEQKCAPLEGDYTGQVVGTVVSSDGLTGRVTTAPSKPQSLPGLVLAWR